MLPPIDQVSDVEMIRDGGSLQASFVGTNGSKYCLWFELVTRLDRQGRRRRASYSNPVVFERLEFRSPNSFEWRSANEVEISWEHATTLLHQFRSHPLTDAQACWLESMEKVASLRGGLPAELQEDGGAP
jgi:hypothetical protein